MTTGSSTARWPPGSPGTSARSCRTSAACCSDRTPLLETGVDIRIPDIGYFADVPVIEVHVTAGDAVAAEDPLITLESDKATMDIPAPGAGIGAAVRVSVGDRVSAGHLIVGLG